MDEVKTYWRDASIKLVGWGTGILAVVAGWGIFQSDLFELGTDAHDKEKLRALALLVFVFATTIGWYMGLRWIHRTHLAEGVDGTVLPWKAIRAYALVVIVCIWLLALITALG